jgi:hypothetical protein
LAARIVWIVQPADAVYVRSVNATTAAWYQGVQTRHEGEPTAGRLKRDVISSRAAGTLVTAAD